MKFFKVRKAEEHIHKVPFEAENAAECAKQLLQNFELYNYFRSEVSLGDMIETKDGNRFIVQDVMDFADKYEKEMKKESAIQQPNKPKPTTMLPDNMQWAWDPEAADWVAVLKDNTNTIPPLYDPNNQNVVNQTTSYMSAVKSACLSKFLDGPQYSKEIKIEAGLIKEGLVKYAGFDFNRGTKYAITTAGLELLRKSSEAEHNEALNEREKLAYLFGFNTDEVSTLDTTGKVIKSDEDQMNNERIYEAKQYLEKYLLENPELFKYQYGKDNVEEVLKELIEENPYWYKKFSSKKWTICEADGSELGEVEADNELDAKVKFGIEHPEYADSQSIRVKEVRSGLEYSGAFEYNDYKIDLFNDTDGGATFVIYAPKGKTVNHESMYKGTASTMDEAITKAYNIIDGSKEIDAKYEEITESHEPYPNPSETPNDHIILENHDGWVNTASFEDDIRKQFQQPHQKLSNSDRDLALLEEQILQLVNDDKKDEVHKLFDQLQFSDKEASVDPKFAKLHELLGQYKKQDLIQLADVDDNLVASGDPQVINNLEHEVKDIGYYCESVSEDTDSDYAETYSLKIFMK